VVENFQIESQSSLLFSIDLVNYWKSPHFSDTVCQWNLTENPMDTPFVSILKLNSADGGIPTFIPSTKLPKYRVFEEYLEGTQKGIASETKGPESEVAFAFIVIKLGSKHLRSQ
jgi:hypothetical protein